VTVVATLAAPGFREADPVVDDLEAHGIGPGRQRHGDAGGARVSVAPAWRSTFRSASAAAR